MDNDVMRLHSLIKEGKCCASAIVQLGIELSGREDLLLVHSVAGLCRGMRTGIVCGALSGAVCMIYAVVFDLKKAEDEENMASELVEWFKSTYTELYGGIDCKQIVGESFDLSSLRCPIIIENTYLQAKSILKSYGYEFS